jgi:hypothetical protein
MGCREIIDQLSNAEVERERALEDAAKLASMNVRAFSLLEIFLLVTS